MSDLAGERKRLRHAIDRMRANLASVEMALSHDWVGSIGAGAAEAILSTSGNIAMQIAKIDILNAIEIKESEDKYRGKV